MEAPLFGQNLLSNALAFGAVMLDEFLGLIAGPDPVEVVDGVGPWASTIDLDAVAAAL